MFPTLWQDARYAVRTLRQSPGFTVVAVLTLALGIGATTAIFSVVHGVLLAPLPYRAPDALLRVFEESPPTTPEFPVSPAVFLALRSQSRAFEAVAAYRRDDLQLGGDRPEQLRGMRVSSGFFQLLGYLPQLGRDFGRDDEMPGRDVAILSHGVWIRRFAADPEIVGRTVRLSGRPVTIVGVLPPGVQHVGGSYRSLPHGDTVDIWAPLTLPAAPERRDRTQHYLNVVGRLRPGVTVAQGAEDVRAVSARLAQAFPDTNGRWTSHIRPLRDEIVGSATTPLLALMAAAGAVLLMACLNVAGLLLGRATGRVREIGVRSALGATRGRLLRQLAVESGVLAAAGGGIGMMFAVAAVRLLVVVAPADTPRLQMVSVDRVVLACAVAIAAATAVFFGLAPSLQLARADVAPALQGGRGAAAPQQRLRRILVAAEIALAFVLVVTGGLLLRSLDALLRVDPGFRPDHVLTAVVTLPPARYSDRAAAAALFERLGAGVRALPGVEAAGVTSDLPWTGYDENTGFGIPGRTFPDGEGPESRYHFLTPGAVGALGLPLLAGRDVAAGDTADAPRVLLVNEAAATQYWGGSHAAIGARVRIWGDTATIVGVVGDVRDVPWEDRAHNAIYFPQAQQWYPQEMFLAIRASGDPRVAAEPAMRILHQLDPELPLAAVRPLDEVAGSVYAARRFTLALVGAFGAAALFLAIIGVYGVVAQSSAQRSREFGLRVALGATPAAILRQVLGSATVMGLAGLAAGLVLALPAARVARALLFRTSPSDPLTLGAVGVLLFTCTLAASYIPAARATRTDPAAALRQD